MKTQGTSIVLEDSKTISTAGLHSIIYTDVSGARIQVPMKLLIHLFEVARYDHERRGIDWKEFCDDLFEKTGI